MTKEEAWAAFAEQYNHRLHGPSDAFKFAWDAATEAERERLEQHIAMIAKKGMVAENEVIALMCDNMDPSDYIDINDALTTLSARIKARNHA